jgi:Flp pilus assembly pilin Flp
MDGLRRFIWDEAATAEATSLVLMIAAVGVLLIAGLAVWYGALNGSFNTMSNSVNTLTGVIPSGS